MKNNDNESFGTLYIDKRLDIYRNYLDDERIKTISSQIGEGTVLARHFFLLLMELRGVSYNASMPYLIPNSIATFHSGFTQGINPNRSLLNFASAIMVRLSREIPQLTKSPRLSRKIKKRLMVMSCDYVNYDKALPVIDGESIWSTYLNLENHTFMYTVWSNQRVSYLSGFSAYDNFMARIVKDALRLSKCRTTNRNFPKNVEDAFGSEVAELAWTSDEMVTLREIRNSLAHAGGELNDQLRQRKHECIVIDDILQITPTDIKRLFAAITSAIKAIVNQSSDNPYLTRELK